MGLWDNPHTVSILNWLPGMTELLLLGSNVSLGVDNISIKSKVWHEVVSLEFSGLLLFLGNWDPLVLHELLSTLSVSKRSLDISINTEVGDEVVSLNFSGLHLGLGGRSPLVLEVVL